MMKSIFCDFLYLTLLYRYRASDFQFPFGPSTSVLPFGQAQAELRDLKKFCALTLTSTFGSVISV